MKQILSLVLATTLSILPAFAGSRTSADYSIPTDTIDAGGVNSQSADYRLRGSAIGEFGTATPGSITSADYTDKVAYAGQLSDILTLAGSRKTHGGAGTFDINLPLSGLAGVECRSGSIYNVVFTFANPLTSVGSVNATATGPTQPGPSSGQIDPTDAHNYIANLTALPNAQYITVTLSNVNDSDGNFSNSIPAVMGLLIGDVNQNRVLTTADVSTVKTQVAAGGNVGTSNFKTDVNANGGITTGDVSIVKGQVAAGAQLP